MKTLHNHVIVYDDECPLCQAYTKGFVACGMLGKDGRMPYANSQTLAANIDRPRAANEIALVNTTTGEVTYGVASLTKIIGHSVPILQRVLQATTFQKMMQPLYAFVSYNRKVIAPGGGRAANTACVPAFNIPYRVAYLVIMCVAVSFLLNALPASVRPLIPQGNFYTELLICAGQLLFQAVFVTAYYRSINTTLHYLGNLITVSVIGALLLVPAWAVASAGVHAPWFFAAWFMGVVAVMYFEHARRVRLLGLHGSLCFTWVGYRLIVVALHIKTIITTLQHL